MSDLQTAGSFLGILVLLILLRVPIGISLIGTSFAGLWLLSGWRVAWGAMGIIPYQFVANWLLSSVPAFLFMGFVCYHSGLTTGLFRAARLWLSRLPGGLAVASVCGCSGFAAVTGSSVACSAAMGKIAIPEMLRHRYDPSLASGVVAVAGTIGALIPPSVLLIMYGIMAQVPIGKLFFGGLVIGLMSMASYICVVIIRVKLNPELAPSAHESVTLGERIAALRETWPIILIAGGVLGGLFAGVFTPTEAGATGSFLSCLVAFWKGTLTLKVLRRSATETVITTAAILIISIGASMLSRFLALTGFGAAIQAAVMDLGVSPFMIIFLITLLYLFLGLFMEPMSAMLLTLPVVLPLVKDAGFELLWFGIFLAKVLEMGMVTPPVGLNVFVVNSAMENRIPTSTIFRGVMWFLVADALLLVTLVAFPGLVPI